MKTTIKLTGIVLAGIIVLGALALVTGCAPKKSGGTKCSPAISYPTKILQTGGSTQLAVGFFIYDFGEYK